MRCLWFLANGCHFLPLNLEGPIIFIISLCSLECCSKRQKDWEFLPGRILSAPRLWARESQDGFNPHANQLELISVPLTSKCMITYHWLVPPLNRSPQVWFLQSSRQAGLATPGHTHIDSESGNSLSLKLRIIRSAIVLQLRLAWSKCLRWVRRRWRGWTVWSRRIEVGGIENETGVGGRRDGGGGLASRLVGKQFREGRAKKWRGA